MQTKQARLIPTFLPLLLTPLAFASMPEKGAQNAVKTALQALASAETAEDWENSPHSPERTLRELISKKNAPTDACGALLPLAPEDLTFFEDALDAAPDDAQLPCREELLARIQDHWRSVNASVRTRISSDREQASTSIPMRDQPIDPGLGGTYLRADLLDGEVALTFDDGPHPERTVEILTILDEAAIKATYFEVGEKAAAFPQGTREVLARGHSLGSHSMTHAKLPNLSPEAARKEILDGHAAVREASGGAGTVLDFFRFPYGARNRDLIDFVKGRGMASFLWNMDALDWKIADVDALFANIVSELNAQRGGILLFHDIHRQTAAVLPLVLDEFRARGTRCVRFIQP